MIPHTGLRNLLIDVAEAEGIPLQYDKMPGGGTDAGRMHIFGAGVPSIVLGVAVRYIHTHTAIMSLHDFDQCATLLTAFVRRLDAETVASLKS
jgi:putative aminopeptidase FrvX